MKTIVILLSVLFSANVLLSQVVDPNNNAPTTGTPDTTKTERKAIRKPIDGIYDKTHIYNRTPIEFVFLREADAMWSKKVWRRIDLREKINHPLHFPNKGNLDQPTSQGNWLSFWDVLYIALDSSETNPYPTMIYFDEFCSIPLLWNQFQENIGVVSKQEIRDPDDPSIIIRTDEIFETLRKSKFLAIDLKEVWFFEKQRSVLDVRIIAMQPILWREPLSAQIETGLEDMNTDEVPKGVGWLYYPEIRPILANNDAFNNFNTSEMKSYDDIFWKRFFSSFVQKEENIYNNRDISNYILNGMDQVLESERITTEIRKFEHDMWEF